MAEATDLSLIAYVIKVKPHVRLCERVGLNLDPNITYYNALRREDQIYDAKIQINSQVVLITRNLALAEIYESGSSAQKASKTLTIKEGTLCTVHPVSTKVFFEASLKGLR